MSENEDKIKQLEEELRIAKLEKELAEAKASNKEKEEQEQKAKEKAEMEKRWAEHRKQKAKEAEEEKYGCLGIIGTIILCAVGAGILSYVTNNYAFMYNPVLGTPAIVKLDDTSKEFEKLAIVPYKEHIVKYDAAKTKTTQAMTAAQMCSLNPKDDTEFDNCIYSILYSKNASNEEIDPIQAIGNEIMEYSGYEETPTISPDEQRGDIIE